MTTPARPAWLLTVVVLIVGLAGTTAAAAAAEQSINADRERRFDASAERARGAFSERLELYSANLDHLRNWMMVQGEVSREQFSQFTALGFAGGLYPGVQALSYAPRVPEQDVAAFTSKVQGEVGSLDLYPPFEVHPPSTAHDVYPVTYLAPLGGNQAAFGFDLGSDPVRRQVVEAARDRGGAVGTPPIRLVQETGNQPGFVLIAPVYDTGAIPATEPARHRHFVGVVTVVFRFGDMFRGVLGARPEADAEMYDLGPTVDAPVLRFDATTRLLDTRSTSRVDSTGAAAGLHRDLDLNLGDRRWRLVLTPGLGFATRGHTLPTVVAILGMLISLLMAMIVYSTMRGRGRAERRALQMTAGLRAAEERSASILRGAPDAMLVIDDSGEIRSANLAAEALFGYVAAEMEGSAVELLLPEHLAAPHRAHRADFLTAPRRREMGAELELQARRRDGSSFPVEVSLSPLVGPGGTLQVIAAVRDVSERRVVQAALQSAYETERQSADQLREADELRTRFLNTISHELRTPLTAISGFTDLLLAASLTDDQQQDYLERIQRNSRSLTSLITEVLVFAHVNNQVVTLHPQPIDLSEAVRLVCEQLSPILTDHTLEVDASAAVPAFVDREAFTRVATNLLTNATRYAPASTKITVSTHQRAGRAVLVVTDEGPGIPPEEQHRVFEPFFRGATALASRTPGTGIGLAVVRELAEQSGGRARVVSQTARSGARLEVELPAHAPD